MSNEFTQIRKNLSNFPDPVKDNFEDAYNVLINRLSNENLYKWAEIGLDISSKSVRSWESSVEYFKSSPSVQRQLPAGQFLRWGRTGSNLCADSPHIGSAFFKHSPQTLLRLRPRYIDDWAHICRTLYRGTWKSSSLSVKIFESTPEILETLNFEEFYKFVEFLGVLSNRSYDQANEALKKSIEIFPLISKEIKIFLDTMKTVSERSWKFSIPTLESFLAF